MIYDRQIQIATDTAKIGVSKLTGKDAPVHDDKETTLPQLRARIADTITFLSSVTELDIGKKDYLGAMPFRT